MLGNVIEWCSDDFNINAYLLMMNDMTPKPDTHIVYKGKKVVRGGGVHHSLHMFSNKDQVDHATKKQKDLFLKHTVHVAERQHAYPIGVEHHGLIGFRCVMIPDKIGTKSWKACE